MEGQDGFQLRLAAARQGAEWALTALYRELHAKLLRYLAAQEPDHAEDIASEVWLDIAANLDRFEGAEADFRAWAFTIARRRLIDFRRREERDERRLVPFDTLRNRGGDELTAVAEADLAIKAALARVATLPHDEAEVVLLRTVGGFTAEEVGMLVHRSTGAVRSLQQRAIRRLVSTRRSELVA